RDVVPHQGAEQERPGGVAVHGQEGAAGGDTALGEQRPGVQQVPAAGPAAVVAHPEAPVQPWIQAGQGRDLGGRGGPRPSAAGAAGSVSHGSSIMADVSPDPTHIRSTRGPGSMSSWTWASVIGTDSAATLPQSARVTGNRSIPTPVSVEKLRTYTVET